jgi:plastocyanin
MNKTIILFLILTLTAGISFSTTHIITNSGFTYSPGSITIILGDTVKFVLESNHNAREVDQVTWDENGTASNGGFDLPFGGGTVVPAQLGIHYYVCVPHASFGMKGTITVNSATDVKPASKVEPNNYLLKQNYPNPFNPATTIEFSISHQSFVSLKVYNSLGEEVSALINSKLPKGNFSIEWNAENFESGIYFYRLEINSDGLQTGSFIETKKMILLK